MWFYGYGKIVVVFVVNFEYLNEDGKWIKEVKGYVFCWVSMFGYWDEFIEW